MKAKKMQSEFYNLESGLNYHEQYFTTQTTNKISFEHLVQINNMLDEMTELMSEETDIEVQFKIIRK
jgi:hypothetical protein